MEAAMKLEIKKTWAEDFLACVRKCPEQWDEWV